MSETVILALISALITNAPALSADVAALVKSLTALMNNNPGASAADAKAAMDAALADAAATDKVVETAGA